MIRPVTRGQWVRLAAGLLLGGAVLSAFRWQPPFPPADPAFTALQAERGELQTFDDSARARLTAERDRVARQVVPVPVSGLKSRLGSRWTWQPLGNGRWALSLDAARPDDWMELLAGVAELDRQPGVFIEEVVIHGDGRAFTQARVTIRVRGQTGETQPGLEPRPGPVFGSPGPDKAPAVGRVRSLRRPGPSLAAALSPGRPWLAPFRPDTRRRPVPC